MSYLGTWTAFAVGGAIYHATKGLFGFEPDWGSYVSSLYWVCVTLLAVRIGWVAA